MVTFKLEVAEGNLILAALAELPFKVSATLIGKLQQQAKEQLDPKPVETAEKSE